MVKLVPIEFKDGTKIFIESTESAEISGELPIKEAGAIDSAKKALRAAEQLSGSIKSFCGRVIESFGDLEESAKPTKASIEFGLNISAEGNVYVVKAAGEASIKIKAEWKFA